MLALKDIPRQDGKIKSTDITDHKLNVVFAVNPFACNNKKILIEERLSILQIIDKLDIEESLHPYIEVTINRITIYREFWGRVYPNNNTVILLRVVPQGGGESSKKVIRTVLTIAVAIAAAYTGVGLAGYGHFVAALASATVTAVGNYLVTQLVPYPEPDSALSSSFESGKTSNLLSVNGGRNQARIGKAIPVVLGTHKLLPSYGAYPYVQNVGYEQFLNIVLVCGYGELQISNIKINDTAASNIIDSEFVVRNGGIGNSPLSIVTRDVFEDNINIEIKKSTGDLIRTTSEVDEAQVDIFFPRGIFGIRDNGSKYNLQVKLFITFSEAGTNNFNDSITNYTNISAKVFNSSTIESYIRNRNVRAWITQYNAAVTIPNASFNRYVIITRDRVTLALKYFVYDNDYNGSIDLQYKIAKYTVTVTQSFTKSNLSSLVVDYSYNITNSFSYSGFKDIRDLTDKFIKNSESFIPSIDVNGNVSMSAGSVDGSNRLITFTGIGNQPIRYTHKIKFSSKGSYDIKITRITDDRESDREYDASIVQVIRNVENIKPFNEEGYATIEARIKATDQINGSINNITCLATTVCLDWDNASQQWLHRATNNPASLFRYVLQSNSSSRPLGDDHIDLSTLQDWHDYCRIEGYECNMVRDFFSTTFDTLKDVAVTGFATPTYENGQWSVVIDNIKSITVQHFTPRNSKDFSLNKAIFSDVEAWKGKFLDREQEYSHNEVVVYNTGFTAENTQKYDDIQLLGVTSSTQVYKTLKRRLTEYNLRREIYSFTVDIENLVCTRGDRIKLTQDVISTGLAFGRIVSLTTVDDNITELVIDAKVNLETDKAYGLIIRGLKGEVSLGVQTIVGSGMSLLELSTVYDNSANNIRVGDLFSFGELGEESIDCLITEINQGYDFEAGIVCIPYNELVYGTITDIPIFEHRIDLRAGQITPFISNIASDESAAEIFNGQLISNIKVSIFRTNAELISRLLGVQLQYRLVGEDSFSSLSSLQTGSYNFTVANVNEGDIYEFRARYITELGNQEFSNLSTHTVVGFVAPPADVVNIDVIGSKLEITYNPPIDFAGFLIRYSNSSSASWETAITINQIPTNEYRIDIDNYLSTENSIFFIKAVDRFGNESVNAGIAVISKNIIDEKIYSLRTLEYHPFFIGGISSGFVEDGVLKSSGLVDLTYTTNPMIIDKDIINTGVYWEILSNNNYQLYYAIAEDTPFLGGDPDRPLFPSPNLEEGLFTSGAETPFFGEDQNSIFFPSNSFFPLSNVNFLAANRNIQLSLGKLIIFRLVVPSATEQTEVSAMSIYFFSKTRVEEFQSNVPVANNPFTISLSKEYKIILRVAVSINEDGGDAFTYKVASKSNTGPQISLYDRNGNTTSGVVDITVFGI